MRVFRSPPVAMPLAVPNVAELPGKRPVKVVVRVVSVFLTFPVRDGLCVVVILVKANGGY